MRNKRGISNIVSTLLIVLLVIVAVGILSVSIFGIIQRNAEELESYDGFSLRLKITNAKLNGNVLSTTVQRETGSGDLKGIRYVFFDGTNTKTLDKDVDLSEEYSTVSFDFDLDELGIPGAYEVSIAPIIKTSSKDKVGGILDTKSFTTSSGGSGGTGGASGGENGGGTGGTPGEPGGVPGGENGNGTGGTPGEGNGEGEGVECTEDGDCATGYICVEESCTTLCNGTWKQDYYEEGFYECDGDVHGCDSNRCQCKVGFTADGLGGCSLEPPIFIGTVFSVWPEEKKARIFQTNNLPKDNDEILNSYTFGSYYVNFSNSGEVGCFGIDKVIYYSDVDRTEVTLNIPFPYENMANITGGDHVGFSIWKAYMCGQQQ